jgi:hypothetical protein
MNPNTRHYSQDALAALRHELRRLRTALRVWFLIHGASRVIVTLLLCMAASLVSDMVFRFDTAQRSVLLAAAALGLAAMAVWLVARPMLTGISDLQLCWHLRKVNFQSASRLLAAMDLAGTTQAGVSADLAAAAVRDAPAFVDKVEFAHVLDATRIRRSRAVLGAAALLLALFPLLAPNTAALWFKRNVLLQNVRWPQRTYLDIDGAADGFLSVVQGDDLALKVNETGVRPSRVVLETVCGGETRRETLRRSGESAYFTALRNINRPMRIRCTGGDADTGWVEIRVTPRPVLELLDIAYSPPAYTRLPRQVPGREWSVFRVVEGGMLSVSGRVSKAVKSAAAGFGGKSRAVPVATSGRGFAVQTALPHPTNTVLTFEVTDTDGLVVTPPPRVPLHVLADRAPTVRAELEYAGVSITAEARIPVRMTARDDFGVSDLRIVCNNQSLSVEGFTPWNGDSPRDFRQVVEMAPFKLLTGSSVSLQVEATDNDSVDGPNKGVSATFLLQVEDPETLRAQLMERREARIRELETVVAEQRDLERRSREWLDRNAGATAADRAALKSLQSAQERLATSIGRMADAFSNLVEEARANALDRNDPALPARLGESSVEPLREAAADPATEAARRLGLARNQADRKAEVSRDVSAAADEQARAAKDMGAILSKLREGGSFDEALQRLQDLIHKQKMLKSKTTEVDRARGSAREAR